MFREKRDHLKIVPDSPEVKLQRRYAVTIGGYARLDQSITPGADLNPQQITACSFDAEDRLMLTLEDGTTHPAEAFANFYTAENLPDEDESEN